jgi:hypothetical protein
VGFKGEILWVKLKGTGATGDIQLKGEGGVGRASCGSIGRTTLFTV